MSEPLNVAVVGTGIGQAHLRALAQLPELYRIAVICDLDESTASTVAAAHGALPTTDYRSVLSDDTIDIVSLCTPPMLHEEQTLAALDSGKHVVCEKPLAGSIAAVDRLGAASARAGRSVFPVFNYRYGPGFRQFLELAGSGRLGEPLVATVEVGFLRGIEYYDGSWRGTKAGELGGCLISHAIHHFDMLLCALGRPTSTMALTSTRVNDIETEDCAAGVIAFDNGAFASFAVTLGCVEQYSRLRLVYRDAVVEFGPGPYETITEAPWALWGQERPVPAGDGSGFMGMFREIHRAIDGSTNHAPGLDDARSTLELVTAMYRAAAEGSPVTFPISSSDDWYGAWK